MKSKHACQRAQKVIYPLPPFPPPLSAPTRTVTRLPSTEQNTQASESLVKNVDFTDSQNNWSWKKLLRSLNPIVKPSTTTFTTKTWPQMPHPHICPHIQSTARLAQLESISSCPFAWYLGEETDCHLVTASFQEVVERDKVPQPPFVQVKHPSSQLS